MKTTAANWFETEAEFRQCCGDAQSQARSEGAQTFAAKMVVMANQWGLETILSEKQVKFLCDVADWVVPPMRGRK